MAWSTMVDSQMRVSSAITVAVLQPGKVGKDAILAWGNVGPNALCYAKRYRESKQLVKPGNNAV